MKQSIIFRCARFMCLPVAGVGLVLSAPTFAIAQSAPANPSQASPNPDAAPDGTNASATAATSQPAAKKLTVPPGFAIKKIGGRTFLIQPEDEKWISEAVAATTPTTRPTTMPADLMQSLLAHRTELQKQVTRDLALPDESAITTEVDQELIPLIQRFDRLDPPIYFMPARRETLKSLLRGGWTNPRFHYNRVMDDVLFDMRMTFATDRPMDDSIIPIVIEEGETPEVIRTRTIDTMSSMDQYIQSEISLQGQVQFQLAMMRFLDDQLSKDIKWGPEQAWCRIGLSGALSCYYAAEVTGVPVETLLLVMTYDAPRAIVPSGRIDLLHPTKITDLRPELVDLYADALRRKSARVAASLLEGHRQQLPLLLQSLRQSPPADGQALLKTIQATCQVDLTDQVRSNLDHPGTTNP